MATIKCKKRPARKESPMEQWLRELDEDIQAAEQQAGYLVDADISDGPEADDEEDIGRGGTVR